MSITVAELRNRIGVSLKVTRLGTTLQSQDQARIDQAYAEVYADLKYEGIAIWASTANIPDEFVTHVVALVADNCLETYPVSDDLYLRIKTAVATAKPTIRLLSTPIYESLKEAVDY